MFLLLCPDKRAWSIVMSMSVCLCAFVRLRPHLRNYKSIFTKFFVHVTCGCGSVLLEQRIDTICISGFTDDVIFAHKLRQLDVTARLRQLGSHAGLSRVHSNTRCRQWTLGTTSCSQGVLNIYDIMFAHNVSVYIVTQKWRVLKVTPQVTTPEAESVVYDTLVFSVTLTVTLSSHTHVYRPFFRDYPGEPVPKR